MNKWDKLHKREEKEEEEKVVRRWELDTLYLAGVQTQLEVIKYKSNQFPVWI